MSDDVEERLDAVERALTGTDADLSSLAADAELVERVDRLAERVDAAEERLEELDAALQAVRGYVGNVRSVNDDVEQRANAAVAGVEALEARLDDIEPDPRCPPSEGTRRQSQRDGNPASAEGRRDEWEVPAASEPRATADADERAAARTDESEGDSGVVARLRDAL
jgi:chromosome segregation ATPase